MRYTGSQRVYVIGQQFIIARSAASAGRLAMEVSPDQMLHLFFPDALLDVEVLPESWVVTLDKLNGSTLLRVNAAEAAQFFEGRTRVELTFPPLDPTFDPATGGHRASSP